MDRVRTQDPSHHVFSVFWDSRKCLEPVFVSLVGLDNVYYYKESLLAIASSINTMPPFSFLRWYRTVVLNPKELMRVHFGHVGEPVPPGRPEPYAPGCIFELYVLLAMLPTRSFAGVAHRALFHPQVSVVFPMCLCSLIFCRLFDATRRRHPLRLLLDRKEAMYAFAYPRIPRLAHLCLPG